MYIVPSEGVEVGTLDLGDNMPTISRNSDEMNEFECEMNEPVALLRERITRWVTLWGHGARGVEDMLAAVVAGLDSLSEDEQA